MVRLMLYKNTFMKIKKSMGRYLSLFFIVMIGVGFFAGIRESSPDILRSLNQYYEEHYLMDFKIVSTMGLTDSDVDAVKQLSGIEKVTPSYSLDVLVNGEAIRVHALETGINTVELLEGRMPETNTECVADSSYYHIGDEIVIGSEEDESLKNTVFTVVGTVHSPLYMAYDYGSTTIGDGKLISFIFVNQDNFIMDAYSELYITVAADQKGSAYSDEYEALITKVKNEITEIVSKQELERYQEIYDKANTEISDNEVLLQEEQQEGEKKLSDAKKELDENAQLLADAKVELIQKESDLKQLVIEKNAEFDSAKNQIDAGWEQIDLALTEYGISREDVNQTIQQLSSTSSDSVKQLVVLQESMNTLSDQEQQLNEGILTFETEIAKAQEQINDGKKELEENEKKLQDGYEEYTVNLEKFNVEIQDAKQKLADAKADLATIEKPTWYINDRDIVYGYENLGAATDTINSVAVVVPIFFILIVMLMTANTMARMIVEERGELGTLSSLGYSERSMIITYLLYVLSATVLGSVLGFFAGCTILPNIIYSAFNIFFRLIPLVISYDLFSLAFILAVAIALMSGVTIFFCNIELRQVPAALLRPVPPKHGQKILLERVPLIWSHLSFTWKVTMRNIFRYKPRVLMTIIGVAGCTSLLLTGFGLRDSSNGIAEKQYGEIFQYELTLVLEDEIGQIDDKLDELFENEKVETPLLIRQSAFEAGDEKNSLDSYLIVPESIDLFEHNYNLTRFSDGLELNLEQDSVIITQKLSERLNIETGDSINIKDSDNQWYSLTVSGVAENYLGNYIYISADVYKQVFKEEPLYNIIVANYSQDKTSLANQLLASDRITNVMFNEDILQQAIDGNSSLNSVVVLIVIVAAILVVIVLYNLTSINISERKREIATLKVLGFTDKESNQYIYREAFLLTLISIVAGLLLGVVFHEFVIDLIESDTTEYFKKINWLSYVWSSLIIMVVSFVMQIITYLKMQTIDMIESLKSVE